MKELIITLPYPPSTNRIWRVGGNRRVYLSKPAKKFRIEVFIACHGKTKFGSANLSLEIKAFPPDHRRRDIDNITKSLLDALQYSQLYDDDSQIEKLSIEKCQIFLGGKVEVLIREIL